VLLLGCGGSDDNKANKPAGSDGGIVRTLICFLTFFLACKADMENGNHVAVKVFLGPALDDNASVQSIDLSGGVPGTCSQATVESADLAYVEDLQGNRYISGFTSGSLHGGWHAGGMDAYVVKYDPSGTMLWYRQFGTEGNDVGFTLAVGPEGGALVAGHTSGDLSGQGNAGKSDVFISRFDSDGNHAWTRQVGTEGDEAAHSITVDSKGIIYVSGFTFGNPADAPRESDARSITIELDSAGNMLQGI